MLAYKTVPSYGRDFTPDRKGLSYLQDTKSLRITVAIYYAYEIAHTSIYIYCIKENKQ